MAQLEVVGGGATQKSFEDEWREREKQFIADLDDNVVWYQKNSTTARQWHRGLGLVVLICAVLAPVTVVSGVGSSSSSLIPATVLNVASVVITLAIAFAEGLRRNYRFEERWTAFSTSRDQLKRLREDYLDSQVGKDVGSDPWIENLLKARKDKNAVVASETQGFFEVMREAGNKGAGKS
jgi:hypothetical protein